MEKTRGQIAYELDVEMTIEMVFPSGAYRISDIINNQLITRQYMGYTKREAVAMFKHEMKGTN